MLAEMRDVFCLLAIAVLIPGFRVDFKGSIARVYVIFVFLLDTTDSYNGSDQ